MPIASIDPNVRDSASSQKTKPNPGREFSDFLGTAGTSAPGVLGVTKGYHPAAVASASITSTAAGINTFTDPSVARYGGNAPYYSSPNLYSAGNGLSIATPGYNLGGTPFNPGFPTGGSSLNNIANIANDGSVGGISPDTAARQQMFQSMTDASFDLLTAQVAVNNISRDFQFGSNVLKAKSDTELAIARNLRG